MKKNNDLNFSKNSLKDNGLIFLSFPNTEFIKSLTKLLSPLKSKELMNLSSDEYRKQINLFQEKINNGNYMNIFMEMECNKLFKIINTKNISVQSNLYLRATRPKMTQHSEYIGWHRESMYSDHQSIKNAYNIWIPIFGVNQNNTLNFIPNSHTIPDNKLGIKKLKKQSKIKRFSDGHKIGLPYSPKVITNGVDFENKKKVLPPKNHYALFMSDLIHGGAENNCEQIRVSIDFRIIDTKKNKSEKIHFSSGKKYFIEYHNVK